jgi:photosystem II stability/assembly factor-like uncharacterized protein
MKEIVRWLVVLVSLALNCSPVWAEGNVWISTGLAGLSIKTLAVDPNHPDTIYAGNDGSGGQGSPFPATGVHVYKTTNGGVSWTEMSNGLPPAPPPGDQYERLAWVSALVVDPENPDTVYAGIYSVYLSPTGFVRDAPPLFKSTDGGANWLRADSGLPTGLLGDLALAADPGNSNTLYAASGGSSQVYKTTDGGTTWNATISGQPIYPFLDSNFHAALAVDPRNSDNVYLGLYGRGIFKSFDAGQTWLGPITGPLVASDDPYRGMEPAIWGVYALAIDPQSPDTIYVATTNLCGCMDTPQSNGAWKSLDGGATWSAINKGLPPVINSVAIQSIWSVVVHPNSIGTLYVASGEEGVYKTTDGGENWFPLRDSLNRDLGGGSLVMTSALPGVLYTAGHGVSKIADQIPVLSLYSEYCATSEWTLTVSNGPPNTTISLTGTGNGQPWGIPEWGTTNANGIFLIEGTFTEQVRGSWREIVDVGGAHSNVISFVVSDCEKK